MSSGINKMWINNDNVDSEAYREGVYNFIRFIVSKSGKANSHSCPCRRCCNGSGQFSLDEIAVHLLDHGMDKAYTIWYYHGEQEVVAQRSDVMECELTIDDTEELEQDVLLTTDALINDVCDASVNNVPEAFVHPEVHKESKYERLKRLAQRPLYPASHKAAKHSLMNMLVKLNDLKTEFNLSNAATEGMLGLLKEILPMGNTLGAKFHEMKCTLKEVKMNVVTYDVCENNCMLFWKEHINTTQCTKCNLSRYKITRVVDCANKRSGARNSKRKRGAVHVPTFKKVARKVMRYFPIIPRLQRLYSIKWIAEAMTWHRRAKSNVDFMRHPCDSAEWTTTNRNWKEFSVDPRSVRLALATDGFSPYGCFGRSYSCWPVIMQPLNLPPSLIMKSEFSLLTVLIPGPRSPTSKLDVFLQPLIEDLNILWAGVDGTWDAVSMRPFKLKAMLLWCIHDFPAYGMLSGCVTQGKFACPICSANTRSIYLHKSRKCSFLHSRMFLSMNHWFRNDTRLGTFNGLVEHNPPPRKLEGVEVEGITSTILNSIQDDDEVDEEETPICTKGFTRRSGLFDLPYWSLNNTRHNLDLMHVEKNVTENLLNTILSLKGTKDTLKAREDLREMRLKRHLWLDEKGAPPAAPFALSKEDKLHFLTTLKMLKVPSGFSANFTNSVNVVKKTVSFKSHDYHMIMQHLLPTLLMHAYPSADKSLFKALQMISIFFNVLCAKVVSRVHLTKAMQALTVAICTLETYFPPSFFVIMIHLMHHLGDEALAAGPPTYRSMWTFEREMMRYKNWARNKRHIEGSITEAYLLHEASLYAMEYRSLTGKGTHKRNRDALFDDDEQQNSERHVGKAVKVVLTTTQFVQARKWILQQQPEYDDWRRQYDATNRMTDTSSWKYAVDDFIIWLGEQAEDTCDMNMMRIANGPDYTIDSYNKFKCNGFNFSTIAYDGNKLAQDSGVSMKAFNSDGIMTTYYGVIHGIFDLNYYENTFAVFYCDWVSSEDKTAFKVDPVSKLVMVNLNRVMPSDNVDAEPFILASQASQVFYCQDAKHDEWSIVIPSPKRLTKAIDALEIDQTMYNSIIAENERLCEFLDPYDGH